MLQLITYNEALNEREAAVERYDSAKESYDSVLRALYKHYNIASDAEWLDKFDTFADEDVQEMDEAEQEVHDSLAWYGEIALSLFEQRR